MINNSHNLAVKKHRDKKRQWILEYLGGKCVQCGSTSRLEIDHIDPQTKSFSISEKVGCRIEILIPELKKCQLLCHDCHMDKTILNRSQRRVIHGSASMYCNDGCRCDKCRAAWRDYCRSKRRRIRLHKQTAELLKSL